MKIGIISDTHNILSNTIYRYFEDVEHIFHAGDIGNIKILDDLRKIAPVSAVYGNIDDAQIKHLIPGIIFEEFENKIICLVHNIGSVKHFSYDLFKKNRTANIIIHGHTHHPSFDEYQNKIFINPGSASFPRNLSNRTIAKIEFDNLNFSHKFIEIKD